MFDALELKKIDHAFAWWLPTDDQRQRITEIMEAAKLVNIAMLDPEISGTEFIGLCQALWSSIERHCPNCWERGCAESSMLLVMGSPARALKPAGAMLDHAIGLLRFRVLGGAIAAIFTENENTELTGIEHAASGNGAGADSARDGEPGEPTMDLRRDDGGAQGFAD